MTDSRQNYKRYRPYARRPPGSSLRAARSSVLPTPGSSLLLAPNSRLPSLVPSVNVVLI